MGRNHIAAMITALLVGGAALANETTNRHVSPQLAADEMTFIYFSNAELTGDPVGEVNYDCWRTKTQWGTTSPYRAQLSASCSGGGSSSLSCPGLPNMICPEYVLACVYYGQCGGQ